jgi:hypothetical protein
MLVPHLKRSVFSFLFHTELPFHFSIVSQVWRLLTSWKWYAGTYIDKKCPFTSNVSIRGRILTGTVNCTKMTRTITVRRDYLHFVPKYQR